MDEVAKITKDLSKQSTNVSRDNRGYRGFIDLGYSIGVGEFYKRVDRLELSTSHGYQFNSNFYLGVGAALNYYHDGDVASVPIFANPRFTIPTYGLVSPFIDMKIGYTLSEYVEGFYLSPSLGVGFDLQNNKAINLSVGYTLQKVTMYYSYNDYKGNFHNYKDKNNIGAITFKAGFEF